MSRAYPVYDYPITQLKGINTKISTSMLSDTYAALCSNCYVGADGIVKRPGYDALNTTSTGLYSGLGIFDFHLSSGTSYAIFADSNGKVYKMDSLDRTWDEIGTGFTTTADWYFSVYGDLLILTNGDTTPQKWDGTGNLATLGGSPVANAKYNKIYKNRVWLAKDKDSTIYYSKLNDAEDYTATGETGAGNEIVSGSDGDWITGLGVLDALYIFKRNQIYRLYGYTPSAFGIENIDKQVGCASGQTVKEIEGYIYFLSEYGIYRFSASRGLEYISEAIEPTVEAINFSKKGLASSVWWPKRNWYMTFVADGSSTFNNLALVYDIRRAAWMTFDIKVAYATMIEDANDEPFLFICPADMADGGFVYKFDNGKETDAGGVITGDYKSSWTPLDGNIYRKKRLKAIRLTYKGEEISHNLDINIRSDYDSGTGFQTNVDLKTSGKNWSPDVDELIWDDGTGTMGGTWAGNDNTTVRIPVSSQGYRFQVELSSAAPSATTGYNWGPDFNELIWDDGTGTVGGKWMGEDNATPFTIYGYRLEYDYIDR